MSPKEKEVTAPADICFHKLLHREDKEDMSFKLVNELPSPAEILEQFPLPEKLAVLKAERDEEIKKVITGESIPSGPAALHQMHKKLAVQFIP